MFFKKKKPLYDYRPKDLSNELLNTLYAGLVAKLTLVTDELIGRHEDLSSLSAALVQTDFLNRPPPQVKKQNIEQAETFRLSANRIRALHRLLVSELSAIKS
jgi:hypothetical protein